MTFKRLFSKVKNFFWKHGGLLAPYYFIQWKKNKWNDRRRAEESKKINSNTFLPKGMTRLDKFYQGTSEEASRILKGERQILHYDFNDPIRFVDIKTIWEENRLHHLFPVVFHRQEFEDAWLKCMQKGVQSVEIFENTNAMEVAIASINAITAFRMVSEEERRPLDLPMGELLKQATVYILEHQEKGLRYSGNHYFFNLLGLMWINSARGAEDTMGVHSKICALLEQQLLDDGSLYEGSTYYHKYVTESLLLYLYEFQDQFEHSNLMQIAQKLVSFCKVASLNSRLIGIGDNDSGRILPLPFYFDYSSTDIGLIEKLTEDLGIQSESISTPKNHFGLYRISKGQFQAFIRLESDLGKCRRVIGNHCHNDQLHVELYYTGTLLLCDTGVYSYVSKDGHRIYPLQTKAHNTLVINGKEQNVVVNSFDYVPRKIKSKILLLERNRFVGENMVFHSSPKTLHRRAVDIRDVNVVISDVVSGRFQRKEEVVLMYHFTPEWRISKENNRNNCWRIFRYELEFELEIRTEGKGRVLEYWYSSEYGSREKAMCLEFVMETTESTEVGCISTLSRK